MKITVVCEHNASMDSEEGKLAYSEGLGTCIAELLKETKNEVKLFTYEQESFSLSDEVIEETDVFFWWGHWHHNSISDETTEKVANRVLRGAGLVMLHSAHYSKLFKKLMGTTCSLKWREVGEFERIWTVDCAHPIAQGLGEYIDFPHEEMYGEQFDIPTPDELVYLGWFQGGEVFRSGCVFNRGRGKIFYFQPGHETFPSYKNEKARQLLKQAYAYVAPKIPIVKEIDCPWIREFSVKL